MDTKGAPKDKLGLFVWYSLQTPEPAKAVKFYSQLFALGTDEFEISGLGKFPTFKKGDMMFADVATPPAEIANVLNADGRTSRWMNNISVENVDQFVKDAERLGGKATAPFDMPGLGRSALIHDPCGAAFMAFTPFDWNRTESAMGGQEGMICWNELMTTDPQKSIEFYGKLMGWAFQKMNSEQEYHAFKPLEGERNIGGIFKLGPEHGPMKPSWMPYFWTENVSACTDKAASLGAQIWVRDKEIPQVGRFSIASDPMGAGFYLFKGQS